MKKIPNNISSLSTEYYIQMQKLALGQVYEGGATYLHRKICRWYSEKFSTKLLEVMELPWDHVISTYYEYMYENMSKKDMEDFAKASFAPDLVEEEEKSNEEFAREVERKIREKSLQKNKTESLDSDNLKQPKDISLTFNDLDEEN